MLQYHYSPCPLVFWKSLAASLLPSSSLRSLKTHVPKRSCCLDSSRLRAVLPWSAISLMLFMSTFHPFLDLIKLSPCPRAALIFAMFWKDLLLIPGANKLRRWQLTFTGAQRPFPLSFSHERNILMAAYYIYLHNWPGMIGLQCRGKIEFVHQQSYKTFVRICYLLCICAVVQLSTRRWSDSLLMSLVGQKLAWAARASFGIRSHWLSKLAVQAKRRRHRSPVAADAAYARSPSKHLWPSFRPA